MLYYNQFDKFNPLTEYLPESPFSYLPKIGWRARSLISGCSFEKIEKIAKRINFEIKRYYDDEKYIAIENLKSKFQSGELAQDEFESFFIWDGGSVENGRWLFRDEMEKELDIPRENNDSEVDALKVILDARDSDFFNTENIVEPRPKEYPEGKDYELFAIMALWLIVDALECIKHGGKNANSIAGDYLLEAMDSVSYGEHLREKFWLISYSEVVKHKVLNDALRGQSEQVTIWREKANDHLKKSLIEQKSTFARQGANARLASDPIQKAKVEIEKEYNQRKSQFKRRGYTAEFVREMLEKHTLIKSIKTIEKLVAKLNKDNELIPR